MNRTEIKEKLDGTNWLLNSTMQIQKTQRREQETALLTLEQRILERNRAERVYNELVKNVEIFTELLDKREAQIASRSRDIDDLTDEKLRLTKLLAETQIDV